MLVIWKERASPLRARFCAGRRVMSSPAKRTLPASGSRLPASWLMKVVLPAPLGPITACVSPSVTSKSMPSHARSAPKLLVNPRTRRRDSRIGFVEDPGEAAPEENDREDEQRAHQHRPVLGPVALAEKGRDPVEEQLQHLLGEDEGESPEHGPGGARDAAEDHHEHQVAGVLPAHDP